MPRAGKLAPRVGEVIAGKYEVTKILGAGGMGVVVAVKHLQLGELYAMKFLLPQAAGDAETHGRFMREARAAVRIKSEHVARVADVGELPDGAPYLLMEYLEGTDLADLLRVNGPLPITTACEYVLQAAAGIAEAHALGIVHRDLKPANLFLTARSDGAALVKVLDFGIAKAIEEGPFNTSLTETQAVFGSPAYMSPEQLRSAKNVDTRSDLWGLGVILYELLTNKSPWQAETQSGLLAAIAADAPDPIRAYRPEVSELLERVVLRCLEKDRNKRYQTVAELVTELHDVSETSGVVQMERIMRLSSSPTSTPRSSFRPVSLRPSQPPVDSARGDFARTEKPWTTQKDPAQRGGRYALLGLGALGAAAAIVVMLVFMRGRKLANVAPATQPVPAVVETGAPPAAASVVATVAASAAPAPPATSAATTTTKPSGKQPKNPAAHAPVVPVVSAAPIAAPVPSPVPSPTQAPVPLDPMGSSH